jgi:16S rRNA C967 or C1407 C5-methylase (RsmB/RsmF family)
VANDADTKRACMLTHQMNRLNTSNITIINHLAQEFPELKYKDCKQGEDRRVRFDRIVCDVPCSSDAAIRKIPSKWKSWSTKDGASLHNIQLAIARRGIELLKVGGKMTYSTCSLNPVENEGVVAALLKEFPGKIRLLKSELPHFKFHPGLTSWKTLVSKPWNQIKEKKPEDSFFQEFAKYEDVPASLHNFVKETMFSNYFTQDILNELPKTNRLMPHYQNTSGFYIAVIEKIAECDGDAPDPSPGAEESEKKPLVI